MDGKRISSWLALVLLGNVGCTWSGLFQTTPEAQATRQPKASTCLAAAKLLEGQANTPNCAAEEREDLLDRARKGYEQALKYDTKLTDAQLGLARLYEKRGEHNKAVDEYRKALSKDGQRADAWFELGKSHAKHKEWADSATCMQRAVDLDPGSKLYRNSLGFTLAYAGQIDQSVACFAQAVGEAKAHYNLARVLSAQGQLEQAKHHLSYSLRVEPDLAEAKAFASTLGGQKGGLLLTSAAVDLEEGK